MYRVLPRVSRDTVDGFKSKELKDESSVQELLNEMEFQNCDLRDAIDAATNNFGPAGVPYIKGAVLTYGILRADFEDRDDLMPFIPMISLDSIIDEYVRDPARYRDMRQTIEEENPQIPRVLLSDEEVSDCTKRYLEVVDPDQAEYIDAWHPGFLEAREIVEEMVERGMVLVYSAVRKEVEKEQLRQNVAAMRW